LHAILNSKFKKVITRHVDIVWQIALYNIGFILSVKLSDFSIFYAVITEMFHHLPFCFENYICDDKKMRKYVTTHEDSV